MNDSSAEAHRTTSQRGIRSLLAALFRDSPHVRILYYGAILGITVFVAGVVMGLLADHVVLQGVAVVLQSLGASILFPILVSFAYDRLRERWLGDEVWRLFSELADAGIVRVYKDREFSAGRDNAQTRLSAEFVSSESGEILMMGPTLRVFFNPLGPFYSDICAMLTHTPGKVHVRALIERRDSPAVRERIAIEQPRLALGEIPQTERDADSTEATIRELCTMRGACVQLRRFMPAPYCTAVIFPHIAFYSPNLLAPIVPVRLPMIVFRSGSHGYRMICSSFDYLWNHPETAIAVPHGGLLHCDARQ